MSSSTVKELLYSLEQTIRDRFSAINDLLGRQMAPTVQNVDLLGRLQALEAMVQAQNTQISALKGSLRALTERPELLPRNPIDGLEVTRRNAPDSLAVAPDILTESEVKLFFVKADPNEYNAPLNPEEVEVEAEEAEAEEEEAVEEAEEEEAEAEEEEVELTPFDYKGVTYYRDSDNNVYAEEDGEVSDEPFGVWNEAKQRILSKK
jgi:hypothetical protein